MRRRAKIYDSIVRLSDWLEKNDYAATIHSTA